MYLRFTDEQISFRNNIRHFLSANLPGELKRKVQNGLLPTRAELTSWQRALHKHGWAAPTWPKEYGGANLGECERLILLDELEMAFAPLPLTFNTTMIGPLLLHVGSAEQKQYWLPKLANMDVWFCQGFSEPNAGSDLASLRTKAEREGDFYIVNGQKIWTTYAHKADWAFCLVRTSTSERKHSGLSILLVDLKVPGVTIRPIVSIDGLHHFNEVFFDNVKVRGENLVGDEGKGWEYGRFLLVQERNVIAHIGIAYARLRHLLRMLQNKQREHASIAEMHLHELMAIAAETRITDVMRFRGMALGAEDGLAARTMPSILKLKGIEVQQRLFALDQKMQGKAGLLHRSQGANYESQSFAASRYLYSRASSIFGGTTEIQKEIIARELLR